MKYPILAFLYEIYEIYEIPHFSIYNIKFKIGETALCISTRTKYCIIVTTDKAGKIVNQDLSVSILRLPDELQFEVSLLWF